MKDVQLPFAKKEDDGRMVTISEALKGLACGCVCPACGGKVIGVKGDIYQKHFRHYADTFDNCRGAQETALHQFAKQIICDELKLTLPDKISLGLMRSATQEAAVAELRADVLCRYDDETVAIEIHVAHKVPPEKAGRLAELEQATLEIDLSNHLYVAMEQDKLRWVVLHDAYRRWVVPPRAVREARALRATELAKLAALAKAKADHTQQALDALDQIRAKNWELEQAVHCARVAKVEADKLEAERVEEAARARREEQRRVVVTELRANRNPPDLQRLIEAHGGYDKIPEPAWRQFHWVMRQWRDKLINGEL